MNIEIRKIEKDSIYWNALMDYAENCPWTAGKHLAYIMRENKFQDWESVFAAIEDNKIIGYCTFMKTDYYPENRYSPWISTLFVDESKRGNRVSLKIIETVIEYAKSKQFSKVYIPSDMTGFYEKYGFEKIDELKNYGGDIDNIFMKEI